ncbi:hypothetical protein LINPERPRIM_LOCUS32973, partial [Linum perenne]
RTEGNLIHRLFSNPRVDLIFHDVVEPLLLEVRGVVMMKENTQQKSWSWC